MKTKLLIAAISLGSCLNASAQTTLYSNDFTLAAGLNIIDADGDTKVWGLYTGDATTAAWGLSGNFAGSQSWATVPLTPDNYLFTTEPIAIPEGFGTTTLSIKAGASNPDFFAEHFAVYLIPQENDTAALIMAYAEANTAPIEETLTAANAETALTFSADVSSFQGQSVRIAVRHYNVTDMELLYIDDILLTQETLATADFKSSQFSVYPNPATNVINVNGKSPITAITMTDINGRTVSQNVYDAVTNAEINISNLSSGVYMMNITSSEGIATKKIVKQ